MSNFDLSNLALQAVCPNNEILYDDVGMPSIMYRVPTMTFAQLGMGNSDAIFPAFYINGKIAKALWFSKYNNVAINGRAYSLPGQDPRASINFDTARGYCEAKGYGWHLTTAIERGLLVRWMQANGFFPNGNNHYGKHVTETMYKATPSYIDPSTGKTIRTATGTGPLTWYHDNSPSGIADLLGLWNWNAGIRSVYGELQIFADNNAADSEHSHLASSGDWKAINASTGELMTPDGNGTTAGSVKMDWINNKLTYSTSITNQEDASRSCTFANITCDGTIGDEAKLILQCLGMLLYDSSELFSSHLCWFNNGAAERLFHSGGSYSYTSFGAASFSGSNPRSNSVVSIGFRSAYAELDTD